VGLTEAKIKDLEDKKFDKLYAKHKAEWANIVADAYDFAKQNITDGRTPRADDVLKALMVILEVNENLRNHQEEHHAKYPRFREYFGDYIIDKHYPELLAKESKTK
jgi:hypothetical protein